MTASADRAPPGNGIARLLRSFAQGDPEEVLADNFAIALLNTPNVHTPELQKKVQELLK